MGDIGTSSRRARSALTHRRAAWLGFLIGLGWTAKKIAADPIETTAENVHKQRRGFRRLASQLSVRHLPLLKSYRDQTI